MKIRKFLAPLIGASLVFAACGGDDDSDSGGSDTTAGATETTAGETPPPASEGGLIGVAMPTQTSERWIADGNSVKEGLEALGFEVDLQFANDDIPTQTQQIDQMITKGAKILIIAAIDGTALTGQLEAAAADGIRVIAYDRLIRDSANVDFYVTFDNYNVGVQQATSLLIGLGLLNEDGSEGSVTGPFNVELFAGSLDDNNAFFFWNGAIDTLEPYFEAGTLVVPSGQTNIEQAAILRWQQETAQRRMEDLLTGAYSGDTELHGVLAPYDGLSRGIITALQNAGFPATISEGFPVVTGQDAEIASVKLIADDVQFSTIFKDTRKLAAQAVVAVAAYMAGDEPEANDTETYDNGVKVVPSYLLESDIVGAGDIQALLIDSGYWTADEVAAGQAG